MIGKCLDEGILQGYLDGELTAEAERAAETHLASCPSCAEALSEARAELAFFSRAFAPDASVSVPTERLRSRVEAAVIALEGAREGGAKLKATWKLKGWLAALVAPLALAPQRAAFAGLAAVVTFAVIFTAVQMRRPHPTDERQSAQRETAGPRTNESPAPSAGGSNVATTEVASNETLKTTGEKDDHVVKVRAVRASAERRSPERTETQATTPEAAASEEALTEKSLPGESTYQQAIASLSRAIAASGEAALSPAVRADYERNLAVVDKAIDLTRRAALRNPQDAEAASFLFSAYQSKIDLLTTVADQTQSAALGR